MISETARGDRFRRCHHKVHGPLSDAPTPGGIRSSLGKIGSQIGIVSPIQYFGYLSIFSYGPYRGWIPEACLFYW